MPNSKDVVVTGVSTGIGWGTTKVLVSKGFRVFGSVRAKPKARYAVIKQRFKNWTLPRLLPARIFDAVVAKQLGFIKP